MAVVSFSNERSDHPNDCADDEQQNDERDESSTAPAPAVVCELVWHMELSFHL
jgi:hypothetical protein